MKSEENHIQRLQNNLLEIARGEPSAVLPLILATLFIKKSCLTKVRHLDGVSEKSWFRLREAKNKLKEINSILSSIDHHNKRFSSVSGLLQRDTLRVLSSGRAVEKVVKLIDEVDVYDQKSLTHLTKCILNSFDEMVGHKGGFGSTSDSIKKIVAKFSNLDGGTVFDPCIGLGSFSDFDPKKISKVYGQEINDNTASLSKVVHYMFGFHDAEIEVGNSLLNPIKTGNGELKTFDFTFSDPPFGMLLKQKDRESFSFDEHSFEYGVTTDSNWMFAQRVLASINTNGVGVVVVSPGALFTQSSHEVRKEFVLNNNINAVVQLPNQLMSNTTIPCALLVLTKNKTESDILFIKADSMGTVKGRTRSLSDDEIEMIVDILKTRKEVPGLSNISEKTEIEKNDFNLMPQKYVQSVKKMSIYAIPELLSNVDKSKAEADLAALRFFKILKELDT
ncbi:MAG: N-6 DNA methylase [Bdellovibrionaceae bacterium]|nr:N-6 DNA methylase [Pseudobdellovibrionaceae bacterium]